MSLDEKALRSLAMHVKRTPGQVYDHWRESKRLIGVEYANAERNLYVSGALFVGMVENYAEKRGIWRAYVRVFDGTCNPDSVKAFASECINLRLNLKTNFEFFRLAADSDIVYCQFEVLSHKGLKAR